MRHQLNFQKRRLHNIDYYEVMQYIVLFLQQVVRIFTSSTFTDMLMERNTLMEYVYPKIKGIAPVNVNQCIALCIACQR